MWFLFISILSLLLSLLTFMLYYKKISIKVLIIYLSISFFIIAIIWYFYVYKSEGQPVITFFPDELTYLYDDYGKGIYDNIIKFIRIIGLNEYIFMRSLNIYIFLVGVMFLFNAIKNNNSNMGLDCIYIVFIIVISSYWSIFILKEAFSMAGLCFYFAGHIDKVKIHKVIGCILLLSSRIHLLIFVVAIDMFLKYKDKYKTIIYSLSFILVALLVFNFRSSIIYGKKIHILRLGNKLPVTSEMAQIAGSNIITFFTSNLYRTAVVENIKRSFNIFNASSMFISLLILINAITLAYIMIKLLKRQINNNSLVLYFYISSNVYLLLTYSTYRYVNVITIPCSIVLLLSSVRYTGVN